MTARTQLLKATPGAVERLGEALFLKVPLYRARKTFTPLYINAALYRRYVSKRRAPWQDMSDTLSELFSVTLDPSATGKQQVGYAYIDRQEDPLMFATRGNAGSGRAYYLGRHFNMKGEKTPLCTSTHPRYSDGVLTMERGVWEAYIANVLDGDVAMGVPPVLAVLDMGETCYVDRSDSHEKRVRVIRIDDHGALDRITHIFAGKKALGAKALKHTARQFGRQEGEKFMQRIMYGAWSSGNITPGGDMLDFDTVCAVKGRCPQYSASAWHSATYFGYEIYGQMKILEAMAKDPVTNKGRVPYAALEKDCLQAMTRQIAERFLYLAGFEAFETLYVTHKAAVNRLAEAFTDLARKFYPKLPSLSLKDSGSYLFHVLDFSVFFRAYPLLKRTGRFTVEKSLQLMMDTEFLEYPLLRENLPWLVKEDIAYFEANAWKSIKEHCVSDKAMLEKIRSRAAGFIDAYDRLYERILSAHRINRLETEARAYVINEDRLYLYPCFTPTPVLAANKAKLPPRQQSEWIDRFIAAAKRTPSRNRAGEYLTDSYVFEHGLYCVRMNAGGKHKKCLTLSVNIPWLDKLKNARTVHLKINGNLEKAKIAFFDQYVTMCTDGVSNSHLLTSLARDTSLMIKSMMVLHEENVYKINDYFGR